MVWLNLSPIPVGRRGIIFWFKWFLPVFATRRGRGECIVGALWSYLGYCRVRNSFMHSWEFLLELLQSGICSLAVAETRIRNGTIVDSSIPIWAIALGICTWTFAQSSLLRKVVPRGIAESGIVLLLLQSTEFVPVLLQRRTWYTYLDCCRVRNSYLD
jgi:hypothetical protein